MSDMDFTGTEGFAMITIGIEAISPIGAKSFCKS